MRIPNRASSPTGGGALNAPHNPLEAGYGRPRVEAVNEGVAELHASLYAQDVERDDHVHCGPSLFDALVENGKGSRIWSRTRENQLPHVKFVGLRRVYANRGQFANEIGRLREPRGNGSRFGDKGSCPYLLLENVVPIGQRHGDMRGIHRDTSDGRGHITEEGWTACPA